MGYGTARVFELRALSGVFTVLDRLRGIGEGAHGGCARKAFLVWPVPFGSETR